jgi:hypothetical protein
MEAGEEDGGWDTSNTSSGDGGPGALAPSSVNVRAGEGSESPGWPSSPSSSAAGPEAFPGDTYQDQQQAQHGQDNDTGSLKPPADGSHPGNAFARAHGAYLLLARDGETDAPDSDFDFNEETTPELTPREHSTTGVLGQASAAPALMAAHAAPMRPAMQAPADAVPPSVAPSAMQHAHGAVPEPSVQRQQPADAVTQAPPPPVAPSAAAPPPPPSVAQPQQAAASASQPRPHVPVPKPPPMPDSVKSETRVTREFSDDFDFAAFEEVRRVCWTA